MLTLKQRYNGKRCDAKQRGIKFKLSFEEWANIWRLSRKYPMIGYHKGQFVMARYGDRGAYEVGNVRIISMINNAKERRQSPETRAMLSEKMKGKRNAKGHKQTKEHIAKIKAAKLRRRLQ